jgi:hypothetical protein
MRRFTLALAATWFAFSFFAACSDDTQDDLRDAAEGVREDVEDAAGTAGARGLAEQLRVALMAKDIPEGQSERHVAVLEDVIADLPGDADSYSGVEDGDGDGVDDDGKVQADVEDQSACLTISEDGNDLNVDNGEC